MSHRSPLQPVILLGVFGDGLNKIRVWSQRVYRGLELCLRAPEAEQGFVFTLSYRFIRPYKPG